MIMIMMVFKMTAMDAITLCSY